MPLVTAFSRSRQPKTANVEFVDHHKPARKYLKDLARLTVGLGPMLKPDDLVRGHKTASTPSHLRELDSCPDHLTLAGDAFVLFQRTLAALRSDKLTEHSTPRDLETALWGFWCELYVRGSQYRSEESRAKLVSRFLQDTTKPWEEFEVAIPIESLELEVPEISAGRVRFVQWEEVPVEWRIKRYPDLFEQLRNHCVALVTEQAGDWEHARLRARSTVDESLDLLRYATIASLYLRINPDQLMFRRAPVEFMRRIENPGSVRLVRTFTGHSITSQIGTEWAGSISAQLRPLLPHQPRSSTDLARRITLCGRWIGAAAIKSSLDDKLIALCTALEALLCEVGDKRKGETIAIRHMLLGAAADGGFTDPFPLHELYEARSKIIHGVAVELCSEEDWYLLQNVVIEDVKQVIFLAQTYDIRSFRDFLARIGTRDSLESSIAWLRPYVGSRRYRKAATEMMEVLAGEVVGNRS